MGFWARCMQLAKLKIDNDNDHDNVNDDDNDNVNDLLMFNKNDFKIKILRIFVGKLIQKQHNKHDYI